MNNKRFELIIFDWDGTLMDSTRTITQAIQASCRELGFRSPSDKAAQDVIGLSITEAFKVACPEATVDDYPKLIAAYQRHFGQDQIPLFDGVFDGLNQLQQMGFFLAVATGKGRTGLNTALDKSNTRTLFDTTRTVTECASKPNPEMIFSICDELSIAPNKALMVGDTTYDLQMAHNAGAYAAALTTGAHNESQLAQVPYLSLNHSFHDFLGWLVQQ
ncbi:HAD-IA family hydrolase [Neisseria sp. Ec49-e6-T10]|uniref:HAD-IA family hydrolase n=1 Tax=Neisseria sp. Ec49-e6-T10 TaxID=3140744 RepID=UPI003EBA4510